MMSVFTTILLIPFLLYTSHAAPNKMSGEDSVRDRDLLAPRQNRYPTTNLYSGSVALPSAWPSFTNPFSTGTAPSIAPTGTANTGHDNATSGGLQPYPTQGAPYQNYTSPYNPLGSAGLVAAPTFLPPAALSIENAAAAAGSSILSNQCQPPQTVTLPPQTVTLPAETITVTAAPQTTTITPEIQTQTITITPQVQTQTVTVTVTVTAGPAPACPSNAGSPELTQVAAPSNALPATPSNAPAASSVPNSEGQNEVPAQTSGPAPGPTPATPSSQIPAPALPTNVAAPSAAPAMPSMPTTSMSLPPILSNEGPENIPAAAPSTTPTVQSPAQPSTTPGSAPTFNAPIPPPNNGPSALPSGASPSLPLTAPYQNTTGPYNNMTIPCGSGMSGTMPGTMPGTGISRPTGGIIPPINPPLPSGYIHFPLPSGYSLQFLFPPNATSGAIPSALTGPTSLPTTLNTQIAQSSDIGPNSPFIPPPALPTTPPMPPINQSSIQSPPLSPFSPSSSCSLNGTSSQNITTNVSPPPFSPPKPPTH
ncbi:hypothetical protein JMJ35_000595 [Cladonia borealis]|uniref:Uncharacterized protein n=1 Tax=Cladonia borealis TaxID=184061 RepID=A0AA39VA44_9LECA|nr:hypothetical protein JMJ35_000595 [Cladonia borealis]